ncbi:MAG: ComEC/Rec2 family competence protein, partial [Alistipes sp.]|nr:ComEC/Rec2 family competence protein [Alistipes sp.]
VPPSAGVPPARAVFPPRRGGAPLMCTLLQAAAAASSEYSGMNALAAAAFLMLPVRPQALFDPSFQLSFLAVAGVIAWGIPLARRCRTGRRIPDLLVTTLAIGLAASLATAPLIARLFGEVPLAGLLLNPLLLLTAYLIVGIGTLWLLLPLPVAAPLFAAAAGGAARLQNLLVATAAELPRATVRVCPSEAECLAIYALFAAATLLLWSAERKKSVSSLPE